MRVVLDAGALVGIDRGCRKLIARLRVLQQRDVPLRTSAAVVAQVWRDGRRQVELVRLLTGIEVVPLTPGDGQRIGELLARTRTSDVVDAHVALLAQPSDAIYTSDVADMRTLLGARDCPVGVQRV